MISCHQAELKYYLQSIRLQMNFEKEIALTNSKDYQNQNAG